MSAHKFQCRDLAAKFVTHIGAESVAHLLTNSNAETMFAEIKTSQKLRIFQIFGEFLNFVQKMKLLQLLLLLDFFRGVFFPREFFFAGFLKKKSAEN